MMLCFEFRPNFELSACKIMGKMCQSKRRSIIDAAGGGFSFLIRCFVLKPERINGDMNGQISYFLTPCKQLVHGARTVWVDFTSSARNKPLMWFWRATALLSGKSQSGCQKRKFGDKTECDYRRASNQCDISYSLTECPITCSYFAQNNFRSQVLWCTTKRPCSTLHSLCKAEVCHLSTKWKRINRKIQITITTN